MKINKLSRCPLCGSDDIKVFIPSKLRKLSPDDFKITDSSYGSSWNFFKCSGCSFVFANPMPDDEFLFSMYSSLEDPDYMEEARGRSDNFKRILKRIKKLKKKGKILDVGASTGLFMKLAREEGFDVYGIEPSKWAVEYGKKNFNLRNLRQGDFLYEDFEDEFDIITMLDLIEHLPDPLKALKKAFNLLKKNGILVVVTPNISSFMARLFGRKWWHIRLAHVNFFNKKSINFALEETGFKLIKIYPYHWKFSFHYLFTRFSFGKKFCDKINCEFMKKFYLKLYLFDSMEVYAEKKDF